MSLEAGRPQAEVHEQRCGRPERIGDRPALVERERGRGAAADPADQDPDARAARRRPRRRAPDVRTDS